MTQAGKDAYLQNNSANIDYLTTNSMNNT